MLFPPSIVSASITPRSSPSTIAKFGPLRHMRPSMVKREVIQPARVHRYIVAPLNEHAYPPRPLIHLQQLLARHVRVRGERAQSSGQGNHKYVQMPPSPFNVHLRAARPRVPHRIQCAVADVRDHILHLFKRDGRV